MLRMGSLSDVTSNCANDTNADQVGLDSGCVSSQLLSPSPPSSSSSSDSHLYSSVVGSLVQPSSPVDHVGCSLGDPFGIGRTVPITMHMPTADHPMSLVQTPPSTPQAHQTTLPEVDRSDTIKTTLTTGAHSLLLSQRRMQGNKRRLSYGQEPTSTDGPVKHRVVIFDEKHLCLDAERYVAGSGRRSGLPYIFSPSPSPTTAITPGNYSDTQSGLC